MFLRLTWNNIGIPHSKMNTHVKFKMEKNQAVRQVLEVWHHAGIVENCLCCDRNFCSSEICRYPKHIN